MFLYLWNTVEDKTFSDISETWVWTLTLPASSQMGNNQLHSLNIYYLFIFILYATQFLLAVI